MRFSALRAEVARHPALAQRLRSVRAELRPIARRVRAGRADWVDAGWRASAGRGPARVEVRRRLLSVAEALTGEGGFAASGWQAERRGNGRTSGLESLALRVSHLVNEDSHRWLLLAVLDGRLPTTDEVIALRRRSVTDGTERAVLGVVRSALRRSSRPGPAAIPVHVVVGRTLVDVEHTAQTDLATGIQRVARLTSRKWAGDRDVMSVGWTTSGRALRVLGVEEHRRAMGTATGGNVRREVIAVVVPWNSTYLLPELVTEESRYLRLAALARFSDNRTGAIGFDCVPVTTAETTASAMGSAFAGQLAALREFDVVAPISHAAGVEFSGWAAMCRAAGRPAPLVQVVPLANEVATSQPETIAAVARRLTYGRDVPLVLVVGSHEPRKNHRAVLHAAERLWRDGVTFSLLFVGGNAWHSERFVSDMNELQDRGRLVESVRGLSDDELWALYDLAWCTVFPSLNEGFGLPVAESLRAGTPVLTSRYGSMREIAQHGGALFVDPRDDDSLVEGLRTLLTDRVVHTALRKATEDVPVRTWQSYADELWSGLTGM